MAARRLLARVAALAIPLAPLGTSADPSIQMVWVSTTGSGTTGTDVMDAQAGDLVTVQVYVHPDAAELSFAGISFDYDPSVLAVNAHAVCPNSITTPPGGNLAGLQCHDEFFVSLGEFEPGMTDDPVAGFLGSAEAGAIGYDPVAGTIELAAIEFEVLATADTTIDVAYVPGLDSVNDGYGDLHYPNGRAVLLPEPGVPLSLLAGAGLLALLGRPGRRRTPRALVLLGVLLLVAVGAAAQDTDGDGVPDVDDNCLLVPNAGPLACDTDQDGYGNACDGDFNNDGVEGAIGDDGIFGLNWGLSPADLNPDMTCDGIVGGPDLGVFFLKNGSAPGPSGLACAGQVPCP